MKTTLLLACTALMTTALLGCGVKQYDETPTCEDLELQLLSDLDPGDLTDAQLESIDIYRALEGEWEVAFTCIPPEGEEVQTITAEMTIRGIDDSSVEIYEMQEEAECDALGVAVYEVSFTDTRDMDLDDTPTPFLMTANLLAEQETTWDPSNIFMLEAQSDSRVALQDGAISFRLTMQVDYNGTPTATKLVTMGNTNCTVSPCSYSQLDYCVISQWTAR